MRKNLKKVLNLFLPDVEGYSDWITVEDAIAAGLNWSSNGNVRRGVAFGVTEYLWEFKRIKQREIVEMRLIGYNYSQSHNQYIPSHIKEQLLQNQFSNFSPNCTIPLHDDDKEIDHRWGRKENYDYDTIDDFQLLSHSHNLFKREKCKKCKETNVRYFPEHYSNFVIGCKEWNDVIGCKGCPLAEPELYR
jgi:hypothetical protein